MNTLVVVVAHAGDLDLYRRHFHLWQRHHLELISYFPEDGGKKHVKRWRELLWHLDAREEDRFVLFEPDSFCLTKEIPEFYVVGPDRVKRFDAPIVAGVVKYAPSTHRNVPTAHFVLHPVILTRSAVKLLSKAWRAIPDDFEGGHSDRTLYRLSEQSGIRIVDFQRYGLGYGDIRVFPSEYLAMQAAIRKGAVLVHGIKEPEAFDLALAAWDMTLQVPSELPVVDDLTACWIPGPYYGFLLKDLDSEFQRWFALRGNLHGQYPELAIGLQSKL